MKRNKRVLARYPDGLRILNGPYLKSVGVAAGCQASITLRPQLKVLPDKNMDQTDAVVR